MFSMLYNYTYAAPMSYISYTYIKSYTMGPTDSVTSSLIGPITVFLSQAWSALISEKVSEYFIRVI